MVMATVLESDVKQDPLDRGPGCARRRASGRVVQPPSSPFTRRRAPYRVHARGGAQTRRGLLRRSSRAPTARRLPGGATRIIGPRSSAPSPPPASRPKKWCSRESPMTRCVRAVGRPKARLEDMSLNGVQAQLCFPNYPRFCGQQFLWGKDRTLASAVRRGVQRLDGGGVVRFERRPTAAALPHPALGR